MSLATSAVTSRGHFKKQQGYAVRLLFSCYLFFVLDSCLLDVFPLDLKETGVF